MMSKPLIGVNVDYKAPSKNGPGFAFVAADYVDCISAAGGIPILLPPIEQCRDIDTVLDRLDGCVLIGGGDLDPRRDGFMLHPTVKPMDARREDFDRYLVSAIIERRMPVFGIGAGMQLLNVASGGNLFLHIPEDLPMALPHRDLHDPAHRHGLEVAIGSLMERVYGDGEVRVNSMHHMAVDVLGDGFRVTARAPDGVVEAIESTREDWHALGTQFHPEAHSASALDIRIFEEFICGITGNVETMRMVA